MKFLQYFTLLIVLILVAFGCESKYSFPDYRQQEYYVYSPDRPLPGSELSIPDAIRKSKHIIIAQALTYSGGGRCKEAGINHHGGKFRVIEVLAGTIDKKELHLGYTVYGFRHEGERAPKKGEKIILFINGTQSFGIIKMLPATEDNIGLVRAKIKEKGK